MRKIRDVLRYRHSAGLSLDAIARSLNLSKGVVAKYVRLAHAAGLTWPLPDDLDDAGLEKLLYRQVTAREPTFAEPDYAGVHQELKRKGVTLTLLWEEYLQAVGERGYQYTAFCTRYKDWTGLLKHSMRQIHRAGEKLFADYAGPMPSISSSGLRAISFFLLARCEPMAKRCASSRIRCTKYSTGSRRRRCSLMPPARQRRCWPAGSRR